jgi:hypothetical protein
MRLTFALALYGVALPALAAAGWYVVTRARLRAGGAAWVAALALLSAYVVGHVGLLGRPPFPPREAAHWTLWVACVAGALSLAEAASPPRLEGALRWALRAAVAAGGLYGMLAVLIEHSWGPWAGALGVAGSTGAALVGWAALERSFVARPGHPATPWWALSSIAAGAALALALTGSLSLGQLAGALAAGLGVTAAAALILRSPRFVPAAGPVPVWILTGLLTAGVCFSSLPWSSALLLALAPATLLVIPPAPGSRSRELWRAAGILLPVGAAVLVAASSASSYEY